MVKICKLEEADIYDSVLLGEQMHKESDFKALNFSKVKITATLLANLNNEQHCYLVAKDDSGKLVGMFSGLTSEYFFGHDMYVCDLALFVQPDRRGAVVGAKLIQAFEDWGRKLAETMPIKEFCLGTTTGVNAERTAKFYEHLGYKQVGTLHKKRL